MKRQIAIREFAIYIPLVVTLGFWLGAKAELGWPEPLRAVSQILSLLVLTTFSIVMLIAARNRSIERIYGGLDKSYALHGKLAKVAWFGMLLHPLLLIPSMIANGYPFWSVLVPFGPWPEGFENARAFGVASYYLFIVLVLVTLFRKVDYQHWLASHKLMGPAYLLGTVHTYLANSDVRNYALLQEWMHLVNLVGLGAWLYKSIGYAWLAQQYRYVVENVVPRAGGIWELRLRPQGRRMNYEPGEFAFISVRNNPEIPSELHPFSISSEPGWHGLRFSIRETGDYTRKLQHAKPGDEVVVYGPYGEFTSYVLDEYKKQVWVGGGIGVTPFLSMAHHEATHHDPKTIYFYYSVKKVEDAVYHGEIEAEIDGAKDRLHYILHTSETEGFLNVERFKQDLGEPLHEYVFLFCGPPPMMQALKKQLIQAGVPPHRIFFEEFNFV